MADNLGDPKVFRAYVKSHTVETNFRSQAQEIVPKGVFEQITEIGVITSIISQDKELQLSPENAFAFAEVVLHRAPKLFASCVCGMLPMAFLWDLLDNGYIDDQFPLNKGDCPNPVYEDQFGLFLPVQKRFNVPFFGPGSIQQLNHNYAIPINLDEEPTSLRGKGAFGEVYEVTIHEDYYDFSPYIRTTSHRFAIKIIQHEASAEREKTFINDIEPLNHTHLVKCLASFTFGAKYYMIYELAEGNLEEFMLRNPTPSIDPAVFSNSWMVEQFCGIAHALLVVHEQEGSTGSGQRRHGYIHDIKPENILVYAYEGQTHCFRLSDFSCAKVVDFIATISGQHEMSHLTLSKTGTPNYRAPEVYHTGKTSRPYDLWSLGCVYLEIVTWYLQGYPALLAFRDARFGLAKPGGAEDESFCYTTEDATNPRNWQLREAVLAKISELQDLCHDPLLPFVNIIPSLLSPMPKERPTAAGLVKSLERLDPDTSSSRDRRDSAMQSESSLDSVRRASTLLTVPVPKPRKLPAIAEMDLDENQFVVVNHPTDKENT